ncbi:hypothetical protein [uncultured Methylobacterium sp.]|uniref:hypothetical protein n=1 Tax=uncultured Methylobacterium sp. TaxID=157278 RepID=UPI0035CB3EF2
MLTPPIFTDDDATVQRVRRELARLEALAYRRRVRAWIARGARGLAGAGGSFALLVKLKVAGSIGGKIIIAALIGLGLALPVVALAVLVILFLLLALVECDPGGSCDWPCDCRERNARRDRLKGMIDERVSWLARRDGPAPRVTPERARARKHRR